MAKSLIEELPRIASLSHLQSDGSVYEGGGGQCDRQSRCCGLYAGCGVCLRVEIRWVSRGSRQADR